MLVDGLHQSIDDAGARTGPIINQRKIIHRDAFNRTELPPITTENQHAGSYVTVH